jgi:hypothetical protein
MDEVIISRAIVESYMERLHGSHGGGCGWGGAGWTCDGLLPGERGNKGGGI